MSDALLGNDRFEKPVWNLHDALNLPEWLSVSLEQRTRYETMNANFRAGSQGGDQQIPLQTTFSMEARFKKFHLGGEFMDARQFGADSGSNLRSSNVNAADLLQGYLGWADQNFLSSGIGTEAIAGRQTLNMGSRRLIARSSFSNSMNSFDGLRLRALDYNNWQFNGFVTMPVNRLPSDSASLLDNKMKFDRPDGRTWFSGGILELNNIAWGINNEVYLYHLDEGESATRKRRYFTPGVRFFIRPAKSAFDFEFETIGQFGTVQASTAANSNRLDHTAWYQHFDMGYTFDVLWKPRLSVEYDYGSGTKNPNGNKDQRFDGLYGSRRSDFGPTGIYGAFSRSNINTPGYKLGFVPLRGVTTSLTHRFFWLAQSKDAWTTANLQDATGKSGNYLGQQLDLSTRWDVNSSLNLETGWAHLFKGQFLIAFANQLEGPAINSFCKSVTKSVILLPS